MDSIALCRSQQSNGARGDRLLSSAASGCHPPAAGCAGASSELAWELIDLFDAGLFAFPVYDHDSARDVVRHLLDRGILEEEIADAVKDSAVDMNTWLARGDRYMVGEWVIAWINACRADYVRRKEDAAFLAAAAGYRQGHGGGLEDFGGKCEHMEDDGDGGDDGGGDCAGWSGLTEEKMEEEFEEEEVVDGEEEVWCNSAVDVCSKDESFRDAAAAMSYGSGLSGATGEDLSPSSPPTPFRRLAPFLRHPLDRHHRHGGWRLGRGRDAWQRAFQTSSSLQHLTDDTEKSDSGIVSDVTASRDDDDVEYDVDYDVTEDEEQEEEQETEEEVEEMEQDDEYRYYCCTTSSHDASLCSIVSSQSRCSCKLPHYARFPTPVSNPERCANCGRAKEEDEEEEKASFGRRHHVIETPTAQVPVQVQVPRRPGQYYKDFVMRAVEYTVDRALDLDGPGYLFVLVDPEDPPSAWTDERRFRIGASHRPDRCVAAYRSAGVQVELLWQVLVPGHGRVTADVQAVLERHRIHSSWFRCTLTVVMETVYDVITRYHQAAAAAGGCLGNEP